MRMWRWLQLWVGLALSLSVQATDLRFFSMGTHWHVHIDGQQQSVSETTLAAHLQRTLERYDQTFSDWSEASELRTLERKGMTTWQKASPLFCEVLRMCQGFYTQTHGQFDITVGAKLWRAPGDQTPVGMMGLQFRDPQTFRFARNPKRLTFGGMLKGYLVGVMASDLYRAGLRSFVVNAGGGNLSIFKDDSIDFLSSSATLQKGHQHILSPQNPELSLNHQAHIRIKSIPQLRQHWAYLGALSDVQSTVATLAVSSSPRS